MLGFSLLRTSLPSGYKYDIYETRMFTWPDLQYVYSQVLMWYVLFWAIYGGNLILGVLRTLLILVYASKSKKQN